MEECFKEYWSFRIEDTEDKVNVSFGEDYLIVSLGSGLYCFDIRGIVWKRIMTTTFYRDPFSDVSITALNAKDSMIAAGTNFMDGKIYLFTKTGRLLWEHQFATIASLGWRPEDITAVGLGDNCVVAGTEFIGEYIYAYTFERKRLFQKRVNGTVRNIAVDKRIVVGTDRNLCVYDRNGEEKFNTPAQIIDVKTLNRKIVAAEKDGLIVCEENKIWRKFAKNPLFSLAEDRIALASGNKIYLITNKGEELWNISFDEIVKQLFYHNGKIYAVVGGESVAISEDGNIIGSAELGGSLIGIGKTGILVRNRNMLKLYPLLPN